MIRRRSTPWIHRWSRPIIGGIATLGVINTAYLTYLRFFAVGDSCPTQTCAVLSSRYATIFGQPLSLFGLLAYFAIAILALSPLLFKGEESLSTRKKLEDITWPLLFLGTTAMLIFSGYLMYVMFSEFVFGGRSLGWGGLCPFCLFSAICATAMFVVCLLGRDWDDRGQLAFMGVIVSMVTLVSTLAIYAPQQDTASASTIGDAQGNVYFLVDATSGESEVQLAKHLKASGAKMYGAFWCPHCCEQKQLFGKEAMKEMDYVECAEGGKDAQVNTCKTSLDAAAQQTGQAPGFPTWFVGGKYYAGRQTLAELAKNSGYTGPQNFKNEFRVCRQP
ncbi:vitamin K epoxide reductase family protein [Alkalinema pantanalense CENA528]|uniref:vitamin K epoxide reductase family protein n=1 Tax=Alkalinema pantanalense TaxID=1620705 RepID=UPI003D6DDD2E